MDKRRSDDNKNKLLYDPNQREQRRLGAFSNVENFDEDEVQEDENGLDEENNEVDNDINNQIPEEDNEQKNVKQGNGNFPIKQVAKNKAKQVASAAGAKAKAAAAKVGAKIATFIATNPWVLLIILGVIVLLILILSLTGDDDEYGHFDELCDYNLAVVNLTDCNTNDTSTMDLGDYVLGVTNALIKNRDFSDDAIEAIMILVKTNTLAYGGYNSTNKTLNLDTCTFGFEKVVDKQSKLISLYGKINNYLYLASAYADVITYLETSSALKLDDDTLDQIEQMEGVTLSNILDNLYNSNNPDADGYQLYNLASFCKYVLDKKFNQSSSLCDTSTDEANLFTYVSTLEGHTSYCDNNNGFVGADYGDGTISIGRGLTNHLFGMKVIANYIDENQWNKYFEKIKSDDGKEKDGYRIEVGTCIPIDVLDKIMVYSFEEVFAKPLDVAAASHGISLTQFQRDALISFNYNIGAGHSEALIDAFANDGYEGLWNFMKNYNDSGNESIKKRRKAEFALFVTGDYTDEGKFYSGRSTNDYDNYDSEGVMAKLFECNISTSGFAFPLEVVPNLVCTSPFGLRDLEGSTNHRGLDMGGVPNGTPIYAGKSGVVVKASNDVKVNGTGTGCGNMVRIKHDDGYQTEYCHMYPNTVCVSIGDQVSQGQKIGEVGNTGRSTGTHLHIGVIDTSGNYIDPTTVFDLSFLGSRESGCHR